MRLGVVVLALHVAMAFAFDKVHADNHRLIRFVNHRSIRVVLVFYL